jgi:hypothetical protein
MTDNHGAASLTLRETSMRISALLAMAGVLLVPLHASAQATATTPSAWGSLRLLEREIAPGQKRKFSYQHTQTFEGSFLDTAVFVARGARPGPRHYGALSVMSHQTAGSPVLLASTCHESTFPD